MNIREIVNEINIRSEDYNIGRLQDIRKEIKGLSKKASSKIFSDKTISEDDWAFHVGGRKEIQFNLAFERDGSFRYGLAFSLQKSRSLVDPSLLYAKIFTLNTIIENQPEWFRPYQMWHYPNRKEEALRSEITTVHQIESSWVNDGAFIFFGKRVCPEEIDVDEVLSTFDDLLPIYEEVESGSSGYSILNQEKGEFKFQSGIKNLFGQREYSLKERTVNVNARHTELQEELYNELVDNFGKSNVGQENPHNGGRIDIVLKKEEKHFVFYEVKVASSAKACIRQAMGQILEYAYWNRSEIKVEMVIAGEYEMDKVTGDYLDFVRERFNMPISYKCIELKAK